MIGATNATWSYEVTLPHEGVWRGSATATDTIGQADLRSAIRDWRIDSHRGRPDRGDQPAGGDDPAVRGAHGDRWSPAAGSRSPAPPRTTRASRTSRSPCATPRPARAWPTTAASSPEATATAGSRRSTSAARSTTGRYTTPFNLTPGTYSFTVRATDDEDNTTSSSNQGRLTINAQYPGDNPPNTTMAFVAPTDGSLTVNLAGTATDETGVDSGPGHAPGPRHRSLPAGQRHHGAPRLSTATATLGTPNGTSTTWSLPPITLPTGRRLAVLGHGLRHARPVRREPGHGHATRSTRATVRRPCREPSASRRTARPSTRARSWSPAAPRTPRPVRQHRLGRRSPSSTRRPVHELVRHVHQHQRRATARRSSTARAAPGRTTRYTTPVIPAGTYSVRRAADRRARPDR